MRFYFPIGRIETLDPESETVRIRHQGELRLQPGVSVAISPAHSTRYLQNGRNRFEAVDDPEDVTIAEVAGVDGDAATGRSA